MHPYVSSAPTLSSYNESKIYRNVLARNSRWFWVLRYLKYLIEGIALSDTEDKLLGRGEVNGSRNSSICEQRVLCLRVAERRWSLPQVHKKTTGLPTTGRKWYRQPLVPVLSFPSKALLKTAKKYVRDRGCSGYVYCSQIMTLINFSLHFKGRICISIIFIFFL